MPLFRGGTVFDGHRYRRPRGRARLPSAAVEVVPVVSTLGADALAADRPRWSTWRRAAGARASPTRTCTRPGRSRAAALRPVRATRPARTTSPPSRRTPPRTRTTRGSPAAAGRCRRSRAARRGRRPRHAWCRTGRCSCPTATTTAPGSTRRALELAGHHRRHPDPPDGRIERDADGHPSGTLHEGATHAGRPASCPRTTGEDYRAALLAGQAYLHSLGITGWQDAIVGSYSGMDDPAPDLRRRGRAAASSRRTWSARCGGTGAGRRADPRPGRPARGADRRAVPGHDA